MIDTLIIVVVMAVLPPQHIPEEREQENRFVEAFAAADRMFDHNHRTKELLPKLKQASEEAVRMAWEQTKAEREKILNFDKLRAIMEELERNSVKTK